jgi:hypothetical protein
MTSAVGTQRALHRLAADLRQLQEWPLAGVAAWPLEDDFRVWHVNGACVVGGRL